jgi:type I restriction enzyme S subunit
MSENMKSSGIVWVGEIPQSWSLTRLQKVLQQVKAKNTGVKEKNLLSLSYGKIITKDIEGALGLIPESYDTYNIVKKGDIVLRLTDMQNDHVSLRTGLVQENQGIITSAYVTLRTTNENSSYYHWYLYAFDITKEIYSFGQGVRQNLTYEELKKMLIPIPPISEQTLIADFLDEQCEKIDSIATNLEKQIEILQKYKKSLITEVVTKGLNKSVSMKDSGIEWIGDIPEHWDVKRLKYVSRLKTGSTPSGNEGINYDNEGLCWFTPGDFKPNMKLTSSEKYIDEQAIKLENITVYPENSVLLVAIGATVGKIGYTFEDSYSNQQITAIMPNDILGKYLLYYISSNAEYIKENALYTTLPIINNSYLGSIYIVVPSENEQVLIANYLDEKCTKIDSIIESKKEQLEKIAQHKKSLIYEYVTGKKRVKGAYNNGN